MESPSDSYSSKWYRRSSFVIASFMFALLSIIGVIILSILFGVHFDSRTREIIVSGNTTMKGFVMVNQLNNIYGNFTPIVCNATGCNASVSSLMVDGISFVPRPVDPLKTYKSLSHTDFVDIVMPSGFSETGLVSIPTGNTQESGYHLLTSSPSGYIGLVVGQIPARSIASWDVSVQFKNATQIQTKCQLQNPQRRVGVPGNGRSLVTIPRVAETMVVGYFYNVACSFKTPGVFSGEIVSLMVIMQASLTLQ